MVGISYLQTRRGRYFFRKRYPRWLAYLYKSKNLGVPGAKIRHSTGKLYAAVSDLSRDGRASFIERYEACCAT